MPAASLQHHTTLVWIDEVDWKIVQLLLANGRGTERMPNRIANEHISTESAKIGSEPIESWIFGAVCPTIYLLKQWVGPHNKWKSKYEMRYALLPVLRFSRSDFKRNITAYLFAVFSLLGLCCDDLFCVAWFNKLKSLPRNLLNEVNTKSNRSRQYIQKGAN